MKRWNGWGFTSITKDVPASGLHFLEGLCGKGQPTDDKTLEDIVKDIPSSKLTNAPDLLDCSRETRFHHSHGQSFPDWIWMRMGSFQGPVTDAVAFPENEDDIRDLFQLAHENNWNLIPHGGGSSVVGHLTPEVTERVNVTVSLSRMNRLLDLDPQNHTATFEAGVLGPDLEAQLQAKGFTLGHYPQSFEFSSLGGWIVTRSSGQQSRYFGRMDENFLGCRLITSQGDLDLNHVPASSAGPDLRHLIAGSEGRMGILSNAQIRIKPIPEWDRIYAFFFKDMEHGIAAVQAMAQTKGSLSMVRLSNAMETQVHLANSGKDGMVKKLNMYLKMRGLDPAKACLCLVGVTGAKTSVKQDLHQIKQLAKQQGGIYLWRAFEKKWKENRFLSAYLRNRLWKLGYGIDTLETAMPWTKIDGAIKSIESAIRSQDPARILVFTHLSHVYETGSSVYTTYLFPLENTANGNLEKWRKMKQTASEAIVKNGGTISHQHGVGKDHAPYLKYEKTKLGLSILEAAFKKVDPEARLNPGKLLGEGVINGKL